MIAERNDMNDFPFRIGQGYDCHALVPGRKLIIGGVLIPHSTGLQGHSDADVLLHAVTDALLGGAGLGDIGRHFPDSDERFAGADSRVLLAESMKRVAREGYVVGNVDATIVAQKPKMKDFIPQMNENIAQVLGVSLDDVNVKATTEEKLGFTGAEQGISAYAVAGIEKL